MDGIIGSIGRAFVDDPVTAITALEIIFMLVVMGVQHDQRNRTKKN